MAQTGVVGKTATKVIKGKNIMYVVYHYTNVVTINKDLIILNTGGWYTSTTKKRMNQASNQFDLGYYVFQKKGNWFVDYKGGTIPWPDENDVLVLEK